MEWGWLAIPAAAVVYCLISAAMFVWPCCKKNNRIKIAHDDDLIVLGAHRGGSIERLENTLPAFEHARHCGMHILEMDVQLTNDKQVVVHHDPSLKRMTGVDK